MKTTKELNIFYASLFLDAIDHETEGTESERFKQICARFHAERDWLIERVGEQAALIDWFQGLAIAIPYTNYEIINLAKQTGHLSGLPTETQEYKILDNYWGFMAAKFLYLCDRKQNWFDTNLIPNSGKD